MSIVSVNEHFGGQEAGSSESGNTATRVFKIIVDAASDGPVAVKQAPGLPRVWSAHPEDPWLVCRDVSVKRSGVPGDRLLWIATCRYTSIVFSPGNGGGSYDSHSGNPLLEPWEVDVGFQSRDVAIDVDYSIPPVPIQNTVGEDFDPPVLADENDLIFRIGRNRSYFDVAFWATNNGTLNPSAVVVGVPGGTWILLAFTTKIRVSARQAYIGAFAYWRVSYELIARRPHPNFGGSGWDVYKLNKGYRKKVGLSGGADVYKPLLDDQGNPLTEPRLLKLDGTGPVDAGAPIEDAVLSFKNVPAGTWGTSDIFGVA